jgi:hypothetical protein
MYLIKIKELFSSIGEWLVIKLGLLFVWLIAYFAPLVPSMVIITVFVIIDYISGVQASRKKGQPITSRRRKDSISKTLGYQLVLITSYLVEKFFLPNFPVLKVSAGFIAFVEVTSIDENVKNITGKSVLKEILKKFPKFNSNKDE